MFAVAELLTVFQWGAASDRWGRKPVLLIVCHPFFFLYYNDAEIDDILLGMRWCCPLLGPLWVCHDISDDDLDEDDQWASKW